MLPQQQSSVVLDAITLNGIGSYIDGARLKIKPLTILAGANGSGKSTWLKALNILAQSLSEDRLPYGFAVSDWSPDNIQITNAYHHTVSPPSEQQTAATNKTGDEFGSPGTIGLEFHATHDLQLSDKTTSTTGTLPPLLNFFWNGYCAAGSSFVIRLAHPTYWDDSAETPHLRHLFELRIDGHVLRMSGERDPLQRFEHGLPRPRRSKPYILSCSRSFLAGILTETNADLDEIIDLARIVDLNIPRFDLIESDVSGQIVPKILEIFETRVVELLSLVLDGYFYVGAVRRLHDSVDVVPETPDSSVHLDRRYVGSSGEFAWQMERRFGANRMRRITHPSFEVGDLQVHSLTHAFKVDSRTNYPKLSRIWKLAEPEALARFEALLDSPAAGDDSASQQVCVDFLNSVLARRDLFDEHLWTESVDIENEQGDIDDVRTIYPDDEIELFCSRGIESLPESDLRTLNYLLVCNSLVGVLWLSTSQECDFDEYLSSWLAELLGVALGTKKIVPPRINQWTFNLSSVLPKLTRPTPLLLSPNPNRHWDNEAGMARLNHSCFGKGLLATKQPPRQLSAGFHQVFPILVQLGVARGGELVGMENPEVHLHPSLQMKIAEMLIHHAASGRRIIVETHSDLVIRRVIRAILEEAISQSQVQVYFVSLANETTTSFEYGDHAGAARQKYEVAFLGSSIEPIQMDSRGRIANWPVGFLDEDVRESQRLMDIMYGVPNSEDDDV